MQGATAITARCSISAADEGRLLDLPEIADAWIAQLDDPGNIGEVVRSTADDPDIDEVGSDAADRYAVTAAVAAVLSTPARDELRNAFASTMSLTEFEQWLRSGSTGADIVRASLLQMKD